MACIARSSAKSAARTFSATASRAGSSASSRKWCRGFGLLVLFGVLVERSHSVHKGLFREPKPG